MRLCVALLTTLCICTHSNPLQAIKAVKRKNPKVDKLSMLRKRNLPSSPHLPLTDQLGSTEHKIRKEIAIMKKCCHPHVVRLLEVIDDNLNERIFMGTSAHYSCRCVAHRSPSSCILPSAIHWHFWLPCAAVRTCPQPSPYWRQVGSSIVEASLFCNAPLGLCMFSLCPDACHLLQ